MRLSLITLLCLLGSGAQAVEFNQIVPAQSRISFGYKQMGAPMDGKFGQFNVQMRFDPANLKAASARMDVNLASIDTGSTEANDEVAGKAWFNTRAFPNGQFVSSSVKALGGNRYQTSGTLTLKGKTQPVTAIFTMQANGNSATFDGAFLLKRLDYAIGEGIWADVATVANEVNISFHLVATAAKK